MVPNTVTPLPRWMVPSFVAVDDEGDDAQPANRPVTMANKVAMAIFMVSAPGSVGARVSA